jgi:hypothetical protein
MGAELAREETKGYYCRFVTAEDGTVRLEPVKVPAHVKAQRAKRIAQRELRDRVESNRARELALNRWSVLFLAAALSICCGICCIYLNLQNQVNERMASIASLQNQVEQVADENELKSLHILAEEDLNEVQEEAVSQLGMRPVTQDQIRYYSVDNRDYMIQYDEIEH